MIAFRQVALGALATLFLASPGAHALEGSGFGLGLGMTQAGGGVNTLEYRYAPAGPFSEAGIAYVGRGLALAVPATDAVESNGLAVSLGLKGFHLRGGVQAEAHFGRRVQAVGGDRLAAGPYAAFLIEPYVGVLLPYLTTSFSQVDLTLYWPVLRTEPASAFQPRVMLSLLFGAKRGKQPVEIDPEETDPGELDGLPYSPETP